MNTSMPLPTVTHRPDGVLVIVGYQILITLASAFFGLILLTDALPTVVALGLVRSLFDVEIIAIGGMAIGCGLLALLTAFGALGLLLNHAIGRTLALIYNALMLLMALPSIPVLLFTFGLDDGIALWVPLSNAIFFALTSVVALWYLTRPSVRAFYQRA